MRLRVMGPGAQAVGRGAAARRVVALVAGVVVGLGVAARATTEVLRIVPPKALLLLLRRPPSTHGEVFSARPVPASDHPRPFARRPVRLPGLVPWYGGRVPLAQVLVATRTNALLVVHQGAIVHEWYRDGVRATTRHPSWSVAKSIVGLLVGQAVERGHLAEGDRIVEVLPELRTGTRFDDITVGHLLDMSSGVDVTESYDPRLPLRGTAHLLLTTDLVRFVRRHRGIAFTPGTQGEYRSIDTQLLAEVLLAREGVTLSQLVRRDLWGPLGSQDDARWNLDRPGGREKAFCGFNATARDFAKIGQLVLDEGMVDGRQVVPASWVRRLRTPAEHSVQGWGYSAQWWHPRSGSRGDVCAIGVYGQYVYVDPATATVVVKLSDHGAEQDEEATVRVFRALADAIGAPSHP